METIIAKLNKIWILTHKGYQHERVVAKQMLDKLLKKHSLTIDDIKNIEKEFSEFKYNTKQERDLITHCAIYIRQSINMRHAKVKGRKSIYLELTKVEKIDMQLIYDHYRKEMKKDLDMFFTAFINRHKIFGPKDTNVKPDPNLDVDKLFKSFYEE